MSLSTRSESPNKNNDTSKVRPMPPVYAPSPPIPRAVVTVEASPYQKFINEFAAQKHRHVDGLRFFADAAKALPESARSFHVVEKVMKNGTMRFFKHNIAGSLMSELEAAAWACYHLIAPDYVPAKANAHYNRAGEYIGVSLQEITDFKSTMDDPLTEKDLLNKDLVKGLAIGLAMSFFFEEDDLHRGNMSKLGFRIDFDMSIWPVLGHFKEGSVLDWMYRPRDEERFCMTARDIDNFPDITDAKPFYWPTKPQPVITEETRRMLSRFVPISKNAFPTVENALFKKLKDDPDFIYHKFKTFLKCMLASEHHYHMRVTQHLREELRHTEPQMNQKKIADTLANHLESRKKQLRAVLVNMSSFHSFLWRDGQRAIKEILQEFSESNRLLKAKEAKKWEKHPERTTEILFNSLIHLEEIKNTYSDIFREAKEIACNIPVATQKLR